jgi:signal transduction histidine kinase
VEPNGVQATFPDDVHTIVFQSVRELLFNVVKHSGTLKARVSLEPMNGAVRITVSDDGKGFDAKTTDQQVSHGLKKMRDRLFLVGCMLEIESEPGKGTRITIEAPTNDSTA